MTFDISNVSDLTLIDKCPHFDLYQGIYNSSAIIWKKFGSPSAKTLSTIRQIVNTISDPEISQYFVDVLGFTEEPPGLVLAVESTSLATYPHLFNQRETFILIRSLLHALSYLHSKGITHGRVLTDNIFLCFTDGSLSAVKLSHPHVPVSSLSTPRSTDLAQLYTILSHYMDALDGIYQSFSSYSAMLDNVASALDNVSSSDQPPQSPPQTSTVTSPGDSLEDSPAPTEIPLGEHDSSDILRQSTSSIDLSLLLESSSSEDDDDSDSCVEGRERSFAQDLMDVLDSDDDFIPIETVEEKSPEVDNVQEMLDSDAQDVLFPTVPRHYFKQVSTVDDFCLALRYDGSVWTWGSNKNDLLVVDCDDGDRFDPRQIPNLKDIVYVCSAKKCAFAASTSFVLKKVFVRIVNGANDDLIPVPTLLKKISNVSKIFAGKDLYYVLNEEGHVWGWTDDETEDVVYLGNGIEGIQKLPVHIQFSEKIIDICPSDSDTFAVGESGALYAWGTNADFASRHGDSQNLPKTVPVKITSITDVVQISASRYNVMALKSDGTVYQWGDVYDYVNKDRVVRNEPVMITELSNISAISCSSSHFSAVTSDGILYCWGWNTKACVSFELPEDRFIPPSPVFISDPVTSSIAGSFFNIVLLNNGEVVSFGSNSCGQLGEVVKFPDSVFEEEQDEEEEEEVDQLPVPTLSETLVFPDQSAFKPLLSSGEDFCTCLKQDGTVWTFGNNSQSQLGIKDVDKLLIPTQIPDINDITAVYAGYSTALARRRDGVVFAWGKYNGRDREVPIQTKPIPPVKDIAVGDDFRIALCDDGTVLTWGRGKMGSLGLGTTENHKSPVEVSGLKDIVQVAAGRGHALALSSEGLVYSWGANEAGQLGNGRKDAFNFGVTSPDRVYGLYDVILIAAGANCSVAVDVAGRLYFWGENIGLNLSSQWYTTPVLYSNIPNILNISLAADHCICITSEKVYCFGQNDWGQLGDSSNSPASKPITLAHGNICHVITGYKFTLFVQNNGTILCSGINQYGQLGDCFGSSHFEPFRIGFKFNGGNVSRPNPHAYYLCAPNSKMKFPTSPFMYRQPLDVSNNEFAIYLKRDFTIWGWGCFAHGQFGSGVAGRCFSPQEMPGFEGNLKPVAVFATDMSVFILTSKGKVFGAGKVFFTEEVFKTTLLDCIDDVKWIAGGSRHVLFLKTDGTVWSMGHNEMGQLGDGTNQNRLEPIQVPFLDNIVHLSASANHSFAVTSGGFIWSWGENVEGTLGTGNLRLKTYNYPTRICMNKVKFISSSPRHGLALTDDDHVWTWGSERALLGNGIKGAQSMVPAQFEFFENVSTCFAGEDHSFVILEDGSIWAYGWNSDSQTALGGSKRSIFLNHYL
ncbi:hypothetical protein GEMRC1_009371 [Eukaryota sp. GEM-RC1]